MLGIKQPAIREQKPIPYTIMGTKESPPPLLSDLKVTIQDSTLIFSPHQSERRSMFLSNIDQVLNFDVHTIHFFTKNPNFPPEIAFNSVQNALQKLLVPYDFLGGRIKLNPKSGRLEIDCKDAGIGFVVASCEYTLDELGNLVYPNPAFEQLVTKKMKDDLQMDDDQPLCIVQVTSFKCGGFAMGFQTNHVTFDGLGFKCFLQNLAALADDKPLAVVPCIERELLAARSPPRVTFTHPELLKFDPMCNQNGGDNNPNEENPNVFDDTNAPQDLDFKIFSLSSNDILKLKAMAKEGCPNGKGKITSFNVVSAHVWRCKALSGEFGGDESERLSTILYAIDIRARLNPPLPTSHTGNAVLTAYATAKCKELEEVPFGKLVQLMSEGVDRMTDEYARSILDWGELYKGFPYGEFLMSSWWRLGFNEVEYPWGKPKYCCPLVHHRKDIILLFPDIDEANGGVNVLVALAHKEMEKFQALFHKFLNP